MEQPNKVEQLTEGILSPNGLEKTPEDTYVIGEFNKYLAEEAKILGLEFDPIAIENIIILDPDEYDKIIGSDSRGSFKPNHKLIFLKRTKGVGQYHALLHEMIHHQSSQVFVTYPESAPNVERLGYHIYERNEREEKLMGFNDGVTELLTAEILNRHKNEILSNLAYFKDQSSYAKMEIDDFFKGNRGDGAFVEMLIIKVAQKTKQSEEEIWKTFKTGMLTGNMMHLKIIEKVFGKGSLKVLAKHGSRNADNTRLTSGLVYDYFFEDDTKRRNGIKLKLLKHT